MVARIRTGILLSLFYDAHRRSAVELPPYEASSCSTHRSHKVSPVGRHLMPMCTFVRFIAAKTGPKTDCAEEVTGRTAVDQTPSDLYKPRHRPCALDYSRWERQDSNLQHKRISSPLVLPLNYVPLGVLRSHASPHITEIGLTTFSHCRHPPLWRFCGFHTTLIVVLPIGF